MQEQIQFDCLVYEMLFIRTLKPILNVHNLRTLTYATDISITKEIKGDVKNRP